MRHERVYLDPTDERVMLDTYIPEEIPSSVPTGPKECMLVLPGGGYENVCHEREGEPIALAFVARNMAAFVLHYRVGKKEDVFPKQLIDVSRAVGYIKTHAESFCIRPDRIYVVGFSAGGHLAGSLATMHSLPEVLVPLGMKAGDNKPYAVCLAYPVVTAATATHCGSFLHLLGYDSFDDIPAEKKEFFSLENQVTADTCPMFVWHTAEDTVVPPVGSLLLVKSLIDHRIPVMAEIFPHGPHGMALGNKVTWIGEPSYDDPLAATWPDRFVAWVHSIEK